MIPTPAPLPPPISTTPPPQPTHLEEVLTDAIETPISSSIDPSPDGAIALISLQTPPPLYEFNDVFDEASDDDSNMIESEGTFDLLSALEMELDLDALMEDVVSQAAKRGELMNAPPAQEIEPPFEYPSTPPLSEALLEEDIWPKEVLEELSSYEDLNDVSFQGDEVDQGQPLTHVLGEVIEDINEGTLDAELNLILEETLTSMEAQELELHRANVDQDFDDAYLDQLELEISSIMESLDGDSIYMPSPEEVERWRHRERLFSRDPQIRSLTHQLLNFIETEQPAVALGELANSPFKPSPLSLYLSALCHEMLGEWGEAIADLLLALELAKTSESSQAIAELWSRLARAHARLGAKQQRDLALMEVIVLDPERGADLYEALKETNT